MAGLIGFGEDLKVALSSYVVIFVKADFTDDDLRQMEGLNNLQVLGLCNAQITDAGLASLARLKRPQRAVS